VRDDFETVLKLVRSTAAARFRICRVEGEEHPDRSWHRVTCHLHRQDVSWAAIPLIYVIGAFSFADARPRGYSDMDYFEEDEWLVGELLLRLRFEPKGLEFDADYVRGRMMKTTVQVGQRGEFVVETRNRHEMALRWLRAIKGKKHLELIV
jgi:hypothetical protein